MLRDLFYQAIYQPQLNYVIRNGLALCKPLLPKDFKMAVSGVLRIQIAPGHTIRLATNPTNSLCKLVFWGARNKHEYTSIFVKLLPHVRGFLDIGASIGYYSMLAGTFSSRIRIHAFEAAPGPFYYLQKNIALNRLSNVQAHQLAISDQDETVSFYAPYNPKYPFLKHHLGGNGSLNELAAHNPNMKKISVPGSKLDTFMESVDMPVDLIKMDTEATEHLVIQGGMHTLRQHRPIIISEVLFNQIEHLLDPLLQELDYRIYRHGPAGLQACPQLQRDIDDGARNFFFVPAEKIALVQEFVSGQVEP